MQKRNKISACLAGTVASLLSVLIAEGSAEAAKVSWSLASEHTFSNAEIGEEPDDLMVLDGDFAVEVGEDDNRFLNLAGSPIGDYSVMLGPRSDGPMAISARIRSDKKKRLVPAFSVGLYGLRGFRLNVVNAARKIYLLRGEEQIAEAPFKWSAGKWTHLHLEVVPGAEGHYSVKGKVWMEGNSEPKDWSIAYEGKQDPVSGKATVWGVAFSGKPIQFDDIKIFLPSEDEEGN